MNRFFFHKKLFFVFAFLLDLPWLWKAEQMSPEVQNRGIIGPMKRTYVPQTFFKKKKVSYIRLKHR